MSYDFITLFNFDWAKDETKDQYEYCIGSNCIGTVSTGHYFSSDRPVYEIPGEALVIGKLTHERNLVLFIETVTGALRLFDEYHQQCVECHFTAHLIPPMYSYEEEGVDTTKVTLRELVVRIRHWIKDRFPHVTPYVEENTKPHASTFYTKTEGFSQSYDLIAKLSEMGLGASMFGVYVIFTTPNRTQIKEIQDMGFTVYRNGVRL